MTIFAKSITSIKRLDISPNNMIRFKNFRSKEISKRASLSRFMNIINTILEYCFAMHIGAFASGILGLFLGKVYVRYFIPSSFPDLSEVLRWLGLPYSFAMYGVILGASLGAIVITILIIKERPCNLKC